MTTDVITFQSEQEWLDLRTKDITSTDVAALFHLSPYKTEFELFHEKRDGVSGSFKASERMRWGNRLEAAIAHGAAEDHGFNIQPLKVYMRDPDLRIGSSFDFEILHPEHGRGIMEIKNVDSLIYRRNWKDDGDGNIEAPEHIELQVQHQMLVSGYEWCAIVPFVGGNSTRIVFRRADKDIGNAITQRVTDFWLRVEANDAPSADYTRDADVIAQLYSQVHAGEVIDCKDDDVLGNLVEQYQSAKLSQAHFEKMADGFKARILERVKTAEKIISPLGTISLTRTKDTPPTVITPEMIGLSYGGRTGYRQFKPTWKKEN